MEFQVEILEENNGPCELLINSLDLSQLKGIERSIFFTHDGIPFFAYSSKTIGRGKVGCDALTAKVLNLGTATKILTSSEKPVMKFLDCKIICEGKVVDWNTEIISFLQKMKIFSIGKSYCIDNLSFSVEPMYHTDLERNICVVSRESEISFKHPLSEWISSEAKPTGCILEARFQCAVSNLLKNHAQCAVIDLRDAYAFHSFLDESAREIIIFTHVEFLSRNQNLDEKISSENLINRVASLLVSRRSIFFANSHHEIPPKIQLVVHTNFVSVSDLCKSLLPNLDQADSLKFAMDNSGSPKIPHVSWDDIGGQDEVKSLLRESSIWCRKEADKLRKFGLRPPKGILLYGPPGCSKTLLVKALASENSANFFSIRGPEIFCKWVGDSEKKIREIFEKARLNKPSLIFFDEFDSIAKRVPGSSVVDRVINQLLSELDGAQSQDGILVVAATNRPDVIDEAILRPGRFDRSVYVPLPDFECISHILSILSKRHKFDEKMDLTDIARKLIGYSGAEICSIFQAAAIETLKENGMNSSNINAIHVEKIISNSKPRTPSHLLDIYKKWQDRK